LRKESRPKWTASVWMMGVIELFSHIVVYFGNPAHLADMEILYAYRIRQMLADTDPVIAPIDQDAWARSLGYLQSSPPELVARYGLNRQATLQLLRRLHPGDLEKCAQHLELNGRSRWRNT
jgi:hypothetical protein